MAKKLSRREREFVRNLVLSGQMRQSAQLAGYSVAGASVQATRLMQRPRVKAYYEALLVEQMTAGVAISKDAIRAKLVTMVNSETISTKDKLTALDMLCRLSQFYKSPIEKLSELTPSEVREAIKMATTSSTKLLGTNEG